jgi:hypothetical protein
VDVTVRVTAQLAERINHTASRGIIAGGIEMQASVVSFEETGEDGDANQRGKQGEHEGAEIGGSTTENEEE